MDGLKYAYVELLNDISKSFIIGVLIAGMITFFIPSDLTVWLGDNRFLSMLVMLVAGIPMYVCATSSTPIAAALILKGLNPGAALVFLLVGPATNAATMNMVRGLFGTRTLGIYLLTISLCSMFMGYALDTVYDVMNIQVSAFVGQSSEIFPYGVELVSACILAALIIYSFWSKKTDHNH